MKLHVSIQNYDIKRQCLTLILVKIALKCSLRDLKTFSGGGRGACPQTLLEMVVFYCKISLHFPPLQWKLLYETLISLTHTHLNTYIIHAYTHTHNIDPSPDNIDCWSINTELAWRFWCPRPDKEHRCSWRLAHLSQFLGDALSGDCPSPAILEHWNHQQQYLSIPHYCKYSI